MRKRTTPVHVAAGILTAMLYPYHPGLSWMLVLSFGTFEYWQEKKSKDTGCIDFWEFVLGLFIGATILWLEAEIILILSLRAVTGI